MAGAGRTVVQPQVIGGGPTGDPFPSRNVDPAARQFLSQFSYLRGAGALLGVVPTLGLPNAGAAGPNWSGVGGSPTLAPTPPPVAGSTGDDCCG